MAGIKPFPFYSTALFPRGSQLPDAMRIFVSACGMMGQGFTRGMTFAETNSRQGGVTPNGLPAEVRGVGIEIFYKQNEDPLQKLAASETCCSSDLAAVLRGYWAWDFIQMTLPGGSLLHPKLPSREAQRMLSGSRRSVPAGGYLASFVPYKKGEVSLPAHPFGWAVILGFPPTGYTLEADVVVKMTLFLHYMNGLSVG